ncbi:MAG: peptidase [Moorea sp. SIO3I7]|nr:peptidase [Moorena sp. SIO3I7]
MSLSATVNLGTLTNTPVTRNSFSVTPNDPKDVFEFRLNGTRNINIAVTDISAGDDADLRLFRDSNNNGVFDSADQQIASSIRGGNNDDSINLADQVTGLYFAQVERFARGSSGSVSYDIALSTSDPSNILHTEQDFGNLSADRSRTGFVGNTDTTDTYEFSIGFFEGVNINLTGLSSDADLRVIRDSNNNGLVDSGEVIRTSTRGGSLSESISDINLSGDYFVQVYQFSGNTNYTLTLDHFTTRFA